MTTWKLLTISWEIEPSVVIGCLILAVGYLFLVRFRFTRTTWVFLSGVGVLFFALVSFLDGLGDTYLFSAHMLQHLLLLLVVPPMLIKGTPEALVRRALQWPLFARTERLLSNPVLAWSLAVGTLWAWHWPPLYALTLESENIHISEHLMFLVTGTIYWWPIYNPVRELRLPPIPALGYLFLAALANTVLGALLTFAPRVIYTGYLNPEDEYGALEFVRQVWRLDPLADQQLGGLFMWVFGMVAFLIAMMVVVMRWYRESELDDTAAHPRLTTNGI